MADFVTLRFDRKSVVALNVRAPLFALEQMIVSASALREFANRVRIAFDGYEEAGDISLDPCVQRFVRELTDLFPYWLHFADKNDDTLSIRMSCLVPSQRLEGGTDGNVQIEINVAAWNDQLVRLRHYMNRLHVQYELTQEETAVMNQSIFTWMARMGLGSSLSGTSSLAAKPVDAAPGFAGGS